MSDIKGIARRVVNATRWWKGHRVTKTRDVSRSEYDRTAVKMSLK